MSDIVERLLDERTDGAVFLRREAAAEIKRLREALREIADGDGHCVSILTMPPKCKRQEQARAALAKADGRE